MIDLINIYIHIGLINKNKSICENKKFVRNFRFAFLQFFLAFLRSKKGWFLNILKLL